MIQEEIIEGNKVIVTFMTDDLGVLSRDLKKSGTVESLHYHDEWDWIMPVVEKLEKLSVKWSISPYKEDGYTKGTKYSHWYEINIRANCCDVYEYMAMVNPRLIYLPHNDPYFKFKNNTKIYAIWLTCIEFIKWYNNLNTK